MRYEVLQHADHLDCYFIVNRVTGRRVVEHVSRAQAEEVAATLEMALEIAEALPVEWPREIDTDTKP